jgi:hypothetical protein
LISLSRKMADILRHSGRERGLQMKEDGWVQISDVVAHLQCVEEDIWTVARESFSKDRPRFELARDEDTRLVFVRATHKQTYNQLALEAGDQPPPPLGPPPLQVDAEASDSTAIECTATASSAEALARQAAKPSAPSAAVDDSADGVADNRESPPEAAVEVNVEDVETDEAPHHHEGSTNCSSQERRYSLDGLLYNMEEFVEFFGGEEEWNLAQIEEAQAVNATTSCSSDQDSPAPLGSGHDLAKQWTPEADSSASEPMKRAFLDEERGCRGDFRTIPPRVLAAVYKMFSTSRIEQDESPDVESGVMTPPLTEDGSDERGDDCHSICWTPEKKTSAAALSLTPEKVSLGAASQTVECSCHTEHSIPEPSPLEESKEINEADATMRSAARWHRYLSMEHGWWWSDLDDDCFLEADPGAWCRFVDPQSHRPYWYLDDAKWFFTDTGTQA